MKRIDKILKAINCCDRTKNAYRKCDECPYNENNACFKEGFSGYGLMEIEVILKELRDVVMDCVGDKDDEH